MDTLHIHLPGTIQLLRTNPAEKVQLEPTAQLLLAYLLLFPHKKHARIPLAGVFWPDTPEQQARRNLNTTLWRLRKRLEPDEGMMVNRYLLVDSSGEIGFNAQGNYWLDVREFTSCIDFVHMDSKPSVFGSTGSQGVAPLWFRYACATQPPLMFCQHLRSQRATIFNPQKETVR